MGRLAVPAAEAADFAVLCVGEISGLVAELVVFAAFSGAGAGVAAGAAAGVATALEGVGALLGAPLAAFEFVGVASAGPAVAADCPGTPADCAGTVVELAGTAAAGTAFGVWGVTDFGFVATGAE